MRTLKLTIDVSKQMKEAKRANIAFRMHIEKQTAIIKQFEVAVLALLLTICVNAQDFEKINCLNLTTTQVKSKMALLECNSEINKVYPDSIVQGFRSPADYGLIICVFNKNNICYLQRIKANYSLSHLLNIQFPNKSIERFPNMFTITFKLY